MPPQNTNWYGLTYSENLINQRCRRRFEKWLNATRTDGASSAKQVTSNILIDTAADSLVLIREGETLRNSLQQPEQQRIEFRMT